MEVFRNHTDGADTLRWEQNAVRDLATSGGSRDNEWPKSFPDQSGLVGDQFRGSPLPEISSAGTTRDCTGSPLTKREARQTQRSPPAHRCDRVLDYG